MLIYNSRFNSYVVVPRNVMIDYIYTTYTKFPVYIDDVLSTLEDEFSSGHIAEFRKPPNYVNTLRRDSKLILKKRLYGPVWNGYMSIDLDTNNYRKFVNKSFSMKIKELYFKFPCRVFKS